MKHRSQLKNYEGQRVMFFGRIDSGTYCRGYRGCNKFRILVTYVMVITSEGKTIGVNHLWFKYGKQFEKLKLHRGDCIQGTATVNKYTADISRISLPVNFRLIVGAFQQKDKWGVNNPRSVEKIVDSTVYKGDTRTALLEIYNKLKEKEK